MDAATLNRVEMFLWLLMAVVVYVKTRRGAAGVVRLGWAAVVLLVLFGVSDAVESVTGAWWRPWWLLVWKGVCVVGLVVCGWRGLLVRRGGE